ncbi:golgin subfamily A member 6C-like [Mizuhopecten yessoensis]|uniref:golgin subfamily A member 6C-like n=1 Tax=Mizuhopecten yessoensis TaxID=6573 RepID=UPI000B4595CC|nr:golgin subfamily A member 6C-like [Mizuhopecten yessoensis]
MNSNKATFTGPLEGNSRQSDVMNIYQAGSAYRQTGKLKCHTGVNQGMAVVLPDEAEVSGIRQVNQQIQAHSHAEYNKTTMIGTHNTIIYRENEEVRDVISESDDRRTYEHREQTDTLKKAIDKKGSETQEIVHSSGQECVSQVQESMSVGENKSDLNAAQIKQQTVVLHQISDENTEHCVKMAMKEVVDTHRQETTAATTQLKTDVKGTEQTIINTLNKVMLILDKQSLTIGKLSQQLDEQSRTSAVQTIKIGELSHKVDDQTQKLDKQSRTLAEQSMKIGELSHKVDDQTQKLDKQSRTLAEQSMKIGELSHKVDDQTQKLDKQSRTLAEQSMKIGELSHKVDDQTQKLDKQSRTLAEQSMKIGELSHKVDDQTQKLDKQSRTLAEQSMKIGELSHKVDDQTQKLDKQSRTLAEQSMKIGELSHKVDNQTQKFDKQSRTLAEQSIKIGELSQKVVKQSLTINKQLKKLDKQSETLGKQSMKIDKLSQNAEEQSNTISELSQEVESASLGNKKLRKAVYTSRRYSKNWKQEIMECLYANNQARNDDIENNLPVMQYDRRRRRDNWR